MKRLFLVRHGKTYFNTIKKTQGWCDSPLTEDGIEDAKKVRSYLMESGVYFDCGYSSTLGRSRDTLEIIAEGYIEKTLASKDLRELSFGRFEGESYDLLPPLPFGDYFVRYGGESEDEGLERFNRAVIEIMEDVGNDNVLVVSHGSIIRQFSEYWQEYTDLDPMILTKNGSIQIYDYEDGIFSLKDYIEP